jgi:hypothetical protein
MVGVYYLGAGGSFFILAIMSLTLNWAAPYVDQDLCPHTALDSPSLLKANNLPSFALSPLTSGSEEYRGA